MLLLIAVSSGCTTTQAPYSTYTSETKLPSSYSDGTALIGVGTDTAEQVDAFSIRGEHLLYKPSDGGTWQTIEIQNISGIQVRRNSRANRIISGAIIGSSIGLGLGIVASQVHEVQDVSATTASGLYPAAGAVTGLLLGIGTTSMGNAPWDSYIPKREPSGYWRFVKEDL